MDDSDDEGGTEAIQYLRFKLCEFPYPTFQLINILKEANDEKIYDDLSYYTLLNTTENIAESKEFDRLYSMLANFKLGNDKHERFCRSILPQIVEKMNCKVIDSRKTMFAVIARPDLILQCTLKLDKNSPSQRNNLKKFLFVQLIDEHRNAVYDVSRVSFDYQNLQLKEYLRVLRLINVANEVEEGEMEIAKFVADLVPFSGEFTGSNQLLQVSY